MSEPTPEVQPSTTRYLKYVGLSDERILEAADFRDELEIQGGKKVSWNAKNKKRVPVDQLPAEFVERHEELMPGEFKVIEL